MVPGGRCSGGSLVSRRERGRDACVCACVVCWVPRATRGDNIPELRPSIGHFKEQQLSQAGNVLLLHLPSLLQSHLSIRTTRFPLFSRTLCIYISIGRSLGGASSRTWSHSAISKLILLIRLTRSWRDWTAWPGWRLACRREKKNGRDRQWEQAPCFGRRSWASRGGKIRALTRAMAKLVAYQHGRVLRAREVVHRGSGGQRRQAGGDS